MPNKFSQTLQDLIQTVMGSGYKDYEHKKLVNAIKRTNRLNINKNYKGFTDLMKSALHNQYKNIDNMGDHEGFPSRVDKEYKHLLPTRVEPDRAFRYHTYRRILKNISHVKRAVHVIASNIISPDDITKQSINTIVKVPEETLNFKIRRRISDITTKLKIEKNLFKIVKAILVEGDYFVEIVDAQEVLRKRKLIIEKSLTYLDKTKTSVPIEYIHHSYDEKSKKHISEKKVQNIDLEVVFKNFDESKKNKDFAIFTEDFLDLSDQDLSDIDKSLSGKKEKAKTDLSNIALTFHDPERVVKLGNDDLCFGYIVFPKYAIGASSSMSMGPLQIPGANQGDGGANVFSGLSDKNIEPLISKTIDLIKRQVTPQFIKDNEDLKKILARFFLATGIDDSTTMMRVEFRYVSPDKMQHFKRESREFDPYGESLLDGVEFDAKLLQALKTALTMHRIINATEHRIIQIESNLSRDSRIWVDELRREFRKRQTSIDQLGSIDSIPSTMTMFENIFLPMKQGTPYVNFDRLDPLTDTTQKVEEIKLIRDSIVAGLDVPPPYVGIEENIESKATLSQENVIFASMIIVYQKELSDNLSDLIRKILLIVDDKDMLENLDKFYIALKPPSMLKNEREIEYLGNLSGVWEFLTQNLSLPEKFIKERYANQFPWNEIKDDVMEESLENLIKSKKDEEEDDGGGGSFGV